MQTKICAVMLTTLLSVTGQCALADPAVTQSTFLSHFSPKNTAIVVQAGGFVTTQGKDQIIGINGAFGDQFTVSNRRSDSVLLGLGYYLNGQQIDRLQMLYGLNAFYLAPTIVRGNVIQEEFFHNLSYSYALTNYPIYVAAKALIATNKQYNITLDLGVGPNIITTSNFTESSLDGGATQPDNIVTSATNITLSATAGFGIQFKHVIGKLPLELSYRFFYLGEGQLDGRNDQVLNDLKTGSNYANALIISTTF